jgi:leucine dehydrogenase
MTTHSKNSSKSGPLARMVDGSYEQVVFCHDAASGLRSIIAVHSTKLGPSLGGCRVNPYPDEESALIDVLRLSQAMTYKSSLAGMDLGGGKAVIIGDPLKDKTPALFTAFGKFVDRLNGAYITAEDVGTSSQDMDIIHKQTQHVTGTSPSTGGAGDPSPVTALGVIEGIKACLNHVFGSPSIQGKTIAIQGVGHVGYPLARGLRQEGANLIVTDPNSINSERARTELGAKVVSLDEIFGVTCDVLAPCALGGFINEKTLKKIKAPIIAGAANNQLSTDDVGDLLLEKGIVYAPDFAINAGGVIHVGQEHYGYDRAKVDAKVKRIYDTITDILNRSKKEKISTARIAVQMAKERLQA